MAPADQVKALIQSHATAKTITAAALASELGLPLSSIQLDGLITVAVEEAAA